MRKAGDFSTLFGMFVHFEAIRPLGHPSASVGRCTGFRADAGNAQNKDYPVSLILTGPDGLAMRVKQIVMVAHQAIWTRQVSPS